MINTATKRINSTEKTADTRYPGQKTFSTNSSHKNLYIKESSSEDIYNRWLQYVEGHKDSTIYNHPLWIKALEYEYEKNAIVLYCENNNSEIMGVLPLMPTLGVPFKKKDPVTAKRFSSLPRTPYGGLLFDNYYVRDLLIRRGIKKIQKNPNTLLQLKSCEANLGENITGLKRIPWRSSYYIELTERPDLLRFGSRKQHYNRRRDVANARKSGLYVRQGYSAEDLQNWYKLYAETMRWHAVPVRPFRFFRFLQENLEPKNMFSLLLAESYEGTKTVIHSGSIFLRFNKTIFYAFNGRKESAFTTNANDLIQWEIIHHSCKAGYKYYNMGEVSDNNGGLAKFKSKWGCSAKTIYHYYNDNADTINYADIDTVKNYSTYKRYWRMLPIGITNALGIIVNRFL